MADTLVKILWLLGTVALVHGQGWPNRRLEERVEALERQGAEQSRLITSLLQRLDSQEDRLQSQSQTMQKQKLLLKRQNDQIQSRSQTLEKQQIILDKQNNQIQSQSQVLEKQQRLLEQHSRGLNKLKLIIRSQSERIKNQEKALQIMANASLSRSPSQSTARTEDRTATLTSIVPSNRIVSTPGNGVSTEAEIIKSNSHENTKRFALEGDGQVAFHAVIDRLEVPKLGINQNIVFDVVLENIGGAYHNQHGVFIAPVNGIYIFSVSILSYINNHPEFGADLKKDGVVLARAFGHGDSGREDQGSVTVVTQLVQGNEVWVSLNGPSGDSIYGNRYSTFMGCLVSPM